MDKLRKRIDGFVKRRGFRPSLVVLPPRAYAALLKEHPPVGHYDLPIEPVKINCFWFNGMTFVTHPKAKRMRLL